MTFEILPAPGPAPSGVMRRLGITPRSVTMVLSGLTTFALLLVMMLRPVPYAIEGAGPTVDTLGDRDGVPLITVDGAPTYETSGELRLTTVTLAGGPGYPVDAGQVIRGWFEAGAAVVPVEAAFEMSVTQAELDARSTQQMTTSQENATVAALTSVGYEVPAVLTIAGDDPSLGAHGVVQEGDVVVSIATPAQPRVQVSTYQDLAGVLGETPPDTTVSLGVERDGTVADLEIATGDDGQGGSILGVYLDPDFDPPVDVSIAIENVGGPSAGTMFALGIIDMMTPGEMTGGHVVAGTGTISLDGDVGPIGGIAQKLYGAWSDHAEFFLAPADNCGDVVGNVPDGLKVIRIATLVEARAAVEAIAAGTAGDLPTCTSAG